MNAPCPDLFRGLWPDAATGVMALGAPQPVPSGTELFRLGDPADRLFVVTRGRIALTLPMQIAGREEDLLIEERTPGETVGWSALIPPHRFTLKATAQVDGEVVAFARDDLLDYLTRHPAVGFTIASNIAEIVGERLQVFQAMWLRQMQHVVDLRTMPARVRT
jgi:CRP-like cAMP-binding protein